MDTHQHHYEERAVFAGCGVRAVGANESNTYRRTQRKNTILRSANQYSQPQRRLECNGSAAVMRRTPQIWYNMQHRHGPETAHVVADTRQGEVFGCIPHGARAYRFSPQRTQRTQRFEPQNTRNDCSRVEHVERVEG